MLAAVTSDPMLAPMRTVLLAALTLVLCAADPDGPATEFSAWLQSHAAAIRMGDLTASEAATGARLARLRAGAFVAAVAADPERGLRFRVPQDLLASLPATVAVHVEQPWSGTVRLEVLCTGHPVPDGRGGGIERWAVADGERLRAVPTGAWSDAVTGGFVGVSGLRIGDALVLLGAPAGPAR